MKIIFLDFDGVMDTAYYDHVLNKNGLPAKCGWLRLSALFK